MIQGLRLSDAVLSVLLNRPGGRNLVSGGRVCLDYNHSRSAAARFWKDVVTQGQNRITRICRQGPSLVALASARELSGPGAWEVDHLYLDGWSGPEPDLFSHPAITTWDTLLELLDGLVQESIERGAQRVFLRCPAASVLAEAVRRGGFYHCVRETVLEGYAASRPRERVGPAPQLRERLSQDTHGLFQLFSASTPQTVRVGLGFTLEQWLHAQEPGASFQWVATHQDKIAGWAGLWRRGNLNEGQVLAHPDRPEIADQLLDAALEHPGPHRWRVPEHQEIVRLNLLGRGFRVRPPDVLMVRTAAARKYTYTTAAVEAWG